MLPSVASSYQTGEAFSKLLLSIYSRAVTFRITGIFGGEAAGAALAALEGGTPKESSESSASARAPVPSRPVRTCNGTRRRAYIKRWQARLLMSGSGQLNQTLRTFVPTETAATLGCNSQAARVAAVMADS
jgi:hypothetical protein